MLAPIRDTARQHFINKSGIDEVKIVEAQLGDKAGVVGAALFARAALS
jgi:hypothetical protein